MQDLKEVRFVASNFYLLQGLKTVPMGLCLILVCLWANGIQGRAQGIDFLAPALIVAGSVTLYFILDHYYRRTYGRVQRTPESRRLEWLVGVVFGILALGAFYLDTSYKLPLSLLGLAFAVGLLADYIRITWIVKGRYLRYYPLGVFLMAIVSLLPLVGATEWWKAFGIRSQIMGISVVIGIYVIVAGIWAHFFLARMLQSRMEQNDNPI